MSGVGSLLIFLITCFVAWTGWKVYRTYLKQLENTKIQMIMELVQKTHNITEFHNNAYISMEKNRCKKNPDECTHCKVYYIHIGNLLDSGCILQYFRY